MRAALLGIFAVVAACGSSGSGSGAGDGGDASSSGSSGGGSGGSSGGGSSSGSGSGGSSGGSGSSSSGGKGGSSSGSASSSGGGSGGSSGGVNDSGVSVDGGSPVIGGCAIFPADNPWNTRVDNTTTYPVQSHWSTYMTTMNLSTHLHPDWGDWSKHAYGIPWQVVPSSQAGAAMTFTDKSQSDPGPYPFPPNAKIEGDGKGGDRHVLVVQEGACELFETFHSVYDNPGWTCGSGAKWSLGSDALRPDGWTSADAAGLPILPGLVKVSEVMAGAVTHAIRFTMNSTQQAYIHPATHAAGKVDATLPPMGLRLRLKAGFDTSGFTGPSLVILTALKEYGLMLADNGSDWYFQGDSDDAWTPLMGKLLSDFDKVTGADFEAVETGPLLTTGL